MSQEKTTGIHEWAADRAVWGDFLAAQRDRLKRMVAFRLDERLRGRVEASDVIQEAFLEASRRLDEYAREAAPMPPFLWLRFLTLQCLQITHRRHLGTKSRDAGREISIHGAASPAASPAASSAAIAAHLRVPGASGFPLGQRSAAGAVLPSSSAHTARAIGLRALVGGLSKVVDRPHMKEDESMRLSITLAKNKTVTPANPRERPSDRPATTTSLKSAPMTSKTRSRKTRFALRQCRRQFVPRPEGLEGRQLLSVLIVNRATDSGNGSLRDVVARAVDGDTIDFAPALNGSTITLTTGEILITKSLTIVGPGAASLAISGNSASRIFELGGGGTSVSFSGLTLTRGVAANGGAIEDLDTTGALTLSNCTFTSNFALQPSDMAGPVSGGAIETYASLSVDRCNFTANQASAISDAPAPSFGGNGEGGAIFASAPSLRVTHSTFVANAAGGGYGVSGGGYSAGGAISWFPFEESTSGVAPVVALTGDTFRSNIVSGGLASESGTGGGADGGAVVVHAGDSTGLSATVSGNTFAGNNAYGGTGGTGGQARGGSMLLDGNFASEPTFVANLDQFSGGGAVGGTASTQLTPGRGGDACGGAVALVAGLAGSPTFTFNNDRVYNAVAAGGYGGLGLNSENPVGTGGDARGGGLFLDAFLSSSARFVVTAATLNSDRAYGGPGAPNFYSGRGGNGGFASGGGLAAVAGTSASPSFTIKNSSVQSCAATGGAGGTGGSNSGGGGGGMSAGGGALIDPGDSAGAVYGVGQTSFVSCISTGGTGGAGSASNVGNGGYGGDGHGGGLATVLHFDSRGSYGDGLATVLQVTVANSVFLGDRAIGGAGGVSGVVDGSGFFGKGGGGGSGIGGAIWIYGYNGDASNHVTFGTDVLSGNFAQGGAGGAGGNSNVFRGGAGGDGGSAIGGGIASKLSGSVHIEHSMIIRNRADGGLGGLGGVGVRQNIFTGGNGPNGSRGFSSGGGISADSLAFSGSDCRTKDTRILANVAGIGPDIDGTLGFC